MVQSIIKWEKSVVNGVCNGVQTALAEIYAHTPTKGKDT